MKADLSKLLQSGLIQGKNPRTLARELKKTFDTSTFNAERLMRTELARVQTEAQKQSFERNGFEEYEFIVNGGCCDICQGLSGKHFKVSKMMPGENAPPMHPHCRCSTAAYSDRKEYEEWLDFLDKGGTTEEYNKLKAQKVNSVSTSKAAKSDIMQSEIKEFSAASEKSFVQNVKGQYKMEDIKKELSTTFKNGSTAAKAVLRKYTDSNSVATWNSTEGTYHQGGKVYLNALQAINNPVGLSTVYFHEFGHLIDFKASGGGTRLSLTGTFGDLIRSDVKNYIENFIDKNGAFGAYRKISEELGASMGVDKAVKFHAISDIFDGVTKGQIAGRYGHSSLPGYWQRTGALESETFANMYQAMFNPEDYALMKKYLPNALAEFEKMLERIAK